MITDSSITGGPKLADTIQAMYREGQTDYSFEPIVAVNDLGEPIGCIKEMDAVIFCCRRGEREIQITEAFTDPDFKQFPRSDFNQLDFVILTLYHEKFKDLPVAFAPAKIKDTLGEIVSKAGMCQLRTTESEKFAHVTFFFNGGRNEPFPGEDDIRVPSLKGISFDQVPQLSLAQVERQVTKGIHNGYDLIVTNFTNGDVIGHTSNPESKIKCAEYVDGSLGRVIDVARVSGYVTMITADHGNLEEMTNPDGTPNVAHTTNRVPFILLDPRSVEPKNLKDGILADVAPTILSALNIEQPLTMDGTSLAPGYDWGGRRKVLLIILDGWGIGKDDDSNPIFLARTPMWDDLTENAPHSILQAAGESVGLKEGKAGNSEAGHINIGAGRIVLQDDVRLDRAMQDGSFFTNEVLCNTIESVKERNGCLHLIGLLTEKSSHGSIDYPLAILRMAKDRGMRNVFLHMIFDGRSTEPGSAPRLVEKLDNELKEVGIGIIATGVGRGIALDRDGNYGKTKRAYDAMVSGTGRKFLAE